jgi:hypothetical protein
VHGKSKPITCAEFCQEAAKDDAHTSLLVRGISAWSTKLEVVGPLRRR